MRNQKGFTLIEFVVTMAIMGIVLAGIYSVYYSQQRSFIVQDEVAEMQQNLRAAMFFMAKEIRMAGCNPTGGAATIGIVDNGWDAAENRHTSINFAMDLRGKDPDDPPDGDTSDPHENVTYRLDDSDGDGVNDILVRFPPGGGSPPNILDIAVAENIDALDFVYLDASGTPTTSLLLTRSVQITLVARTGRGDPGYTDTTTYRNLRGDPIYGPANDNFRRKRLATNIKCRNMGLL